MYKYPSQMERSLKRLMPRLETRFAAQAAAAPAAWDQFIARLRTHFPRLFEIYFQLYSSQYDFFTISRTCSRCWPRSGLPGRTI